ncbi:DUF4089 domain-containing protein [Novosphingobium sp. FKTRR1]|uniref:DUF4089 domain-containing protein n=1 Tax=Novosphingobium sp. FKTRR1 TaxID=2879118 RepID=UPI001CEFD577|nr:DUF4089 domain-containing protein [Novosphingobium sp. FKTRR1]
MSQDDTPSPIPANRAALVAQIALTEERARARAEALGLTIPAGCLPGVLANLALLQGHAANLLGPTG